MRDVSSLESLTLIEVNFFNRFKIIVVDSQVRMCELLISRQLELTQLFNNNIHLSDIN